MKEAPNKLPSMRKFFLFSDILVCGAPIKSTNRKLRLSMLSTASTISTNITPNGSDTALSVSLPTLTTGTAKIGSASSSSDHLKSSSLSLPSTTITNATIATTTSTASNPPTSSSQHIQFIEADMIKSKSAEKSTHLALPSGAVSACSLSRSSSAGNASTTSGSIPLAAPCTPLFERQIVISLGSLMVNLVGGDDYTISVTKGKESFSIRARSMAERDEWYKAFTDALTGYRELQARRAREQTPDLTTVVRRGGAGANAAMGSNRHPGHRSRTMDDGFRRSWAGSTVSHTLSISTKSPLSTETTGNTANNTYTANPNDPKTYSGERSSGVYDSLRFWQTPRVLQRKDSMSSEISRQSDLDGVAWVPDEMVDTCMVCKKTKFGMMVRKHHCRRCGFVICWNCSEMRRSISQPERKVRTCVDCVATCDGTGWMAVECQDDQPRDGTITSQIVNTPEKEFDSPTSRNNPETKPFEEDKAKLKEVDSEGQSLSSSKDTLDASCDTLTTLNNTAKSDL
ncbi:hypothetical protein BDF19DRAFT_61986 [Syncephalis fuscata]|nr:hypothetical protein BDF19DRAFT_61986 [Syncephalis fuscata]